MKNFKIDTVQVIGVLGGVFAVAGSMLTPVLVGTLYKITGLVLWSAIDSNI